MLGAFFFLSCALIPLSLALDSLLCANSHAYAIRVEVFREWEDARGGRQDQETGKNPERRYLNYELTASHVYKVRGIRIEVWRIFFIHSLDLSFGIK